MMRNYTLFISILIILLQGLFTIAAADERSVIPPGHEQMLSMELDPPELINGFKLESIQILKNDIRLLFKMGDESGTFLLSLNEQASKLQQNCSIAGTLLLCMNLPVHKVLAETYVKYLLDNNRDKRIAKAWNQQAKPKDTAKKITTGKEAYCPTPKIWIVLIFVAFVLTLFAGFFRMSHADKKLHKILLLILAVAFLHITFSMLASVLANSLLNLELEIFSILIVLMVLYYLLTVQRFQLKLLLYQTKDTFILVFAAVALIMAIGMSGNFPQFINGIIGQLKLSWIESDTLRALFSNIYFYLLSLAIVGLAVYQAKQEKHFFIKLLIPFSIGFLLSIFPGWQIIQNIEFSRPESIWLELQPGFQLANGSLEHFGQYLMGAAFLSGSFFKLFGTGLVALNIFKLICLMFAIMAIAISSRILFKSNLSAFVAAALFAIHPAMWQIAFESWWFFLATGFISLSVAITVLSARRKSLPLSLLAVLLIQFAFEIRMEAVLLFVLFYLIQMLYEFPNKSLCRLVLPIFCINLFRMLLISFGEGHLNAEIAGENAGYYLYLFAEILPIFVLMIPGFIFAYRSFPKTVIIVLSWVLGLLLLYGATQSKPSHSEATLIVTPIFLLISAMFGHNKKRVRIDAVGYAVSGLVAVVMLLAVFYTTENSRTEWKNWFERKIETGKQSILLLNNLPDNAIVLLDTTYLSFVFPERKVLSETQRRITIDEVKNLLLPEQRAYCLNDEQSSELCCFYEFGRDHKVNLEYHYQRCWKAKLLEREIKVIASAGNLRLLEFEKSIK